MELTLLPLLFRNNTHTEVKRSFKLFSFRNVTNAKELLQMIRHQNSTFPQCTAVDASRIYSKFQLQIACTKAILNFAGSIARSKSLYVEIMLCLSPTVNISDALNKFGITSTTRDIFIIIDSADENMASKFKELVKGDYEESPSFSGRDLAGLCSIYGIQDVSRCESHILNAMAIQGL